MTPADHKSTAPESYLWGKDCERARRGEHSHARHVVVRAERSTSRARAPSSSYPLFVSTSGAT